MLMPPELVEDTEAILGRVRGGEKVDHYQTRRRRKDGTIIDVSLTVSPIRFFLMRRRRARSTLFPYTTLFRSELVNERLAAIVGSSDDIIASKDLDGVI